MKKLSAAQVIALHDELIKIFGGTPGLRDKGLLESALSAPFMSFDGEEVYPSVQQKAAQLCYGLIKNHAFIDGNKRIGAHAMLVFLDINGIELEYAQPELVEIILSTADGKSGFEELLKWVANHLK